MSRVTIVYILVLIASAAGLWGVLRLGSGLRPPTDLSGVWEIGGEDPVVPQVLGQSVNIEQSGRFFQMSFERGLSVNLKLLSETQAASKESNSFGMLFAGPKWQLSAIGESREGPFLFRLTGPQTHSFTVTRPRSPAEDRPAAPAPPSAAPAAAASAQQAVAVEKSETHAP